MARGLMSEETREQFAEDDRYFGSNKDAAALYLRDIGKYAKDDNEERLLRRKADLQRLIYEAEMQTGILCDEAAGIVGTLKDRDYVLTRTYTTNRVRIVLARVDKNREKYGEESLNEMRALSNLGLKYDEASEMLKETEEKDKEEFTVERSYNAKWLESYAQQLSPMKAGVEDIINKVWEANLDCVIPLARKYARPGIELMDLVQEGNLELREGIETFDPDNGGSFMGYVFLYIRRGVLSVVRDKSRNIRIPKERTHTSTRIKAYLFQYGAENKEQPTIEQIAQALDIEERYVLTALTSAQPEVSLSQVGKVFDGIELQELFKSPDSTILSHRQELHDMLVEELERMASKSTPTKYRISMRDVFIIKHRFGIGADKVATDKIAKMLYKKGITKQRLKEATIRQIQRRAFKKLRENPTLQILIGELC